MKKLLIAMTAAAVGFGAWAEDGSSADGGNTTTVNYLNESFGEGWTLDNNAFWTYSGEVADGELTVGDALTLNTGSKVLTGSFADNKSAVPMSKRAYFNATVTFNDPSDTLPELANGDKFALVVLDNVECVEAEMIQESKRATNLG